jgi:hypothetical protein
MTIAIPRNAVAAASWRGTALIVLPVIVVCSGKRFQ